MSAEPAFAPATFAAATPTSRAAASTASASGYAAGYAAGFNAGSKAAAVAAAEAERRREADEIAHAARRAADAETALTVLAQTAAAARARTAPVIGDALETVVRAAVELAEALLGAELADDDTSARTALTRALTEAGEDDVVRVRLNPEDHAHLRTMLEAQPGTLDIPAGIELVPDPSLARGDAVSELTEGFLDARLGSALARARAALEVRQ
ncbi:FliH/SctL family protein [Georgenia yuyongxinii]|uniref:Flagellar assembly protein FliH n=1 Tax=Georgenia yuyongxinii TaxID=2589797 RepID=A0A552WSD3_9MICO|nr:FliH/SctL family protein [Georgenia yuyongxinii]TRW45625.1 flagellar assembly protein FliH [Georgenia yuyongxinii]